jgi:hypothetical protein
LRARRNRLSTGTGQSFQEQLEIQNVNMGLGATDLRGNVILSSVYGNIVLSQVFVRAFLITGFGSLRRKCSLSQLTAREFEIRQLKIEHQLSIENCSIEKVTIGPLAADNGGRLIFKENKPTANAHILLETINDGLISGQFGKLTLSGNHRKKLVIENVQVDWLNFQNVFNEQGLLSLNEISISKKGTLEIKSSNLGKADFLGCDFSMARFDFKNSKIAEIFSSATTFPRRPATKTREAYSQAQLAYGQLAASFGKQGDTVRAYTYQSYEIQAHFNNMHWLSRDFFIWLNLGLNKISNNFGRWWALGVFFTFVIGWLFFYFLILTTEEVDVAFNLIPDWKLVISFLKFMNPLRTFDTEAIFKINDKSYITLTERPTC